MKSSASEPVFSNLAITELQVLPGNVRSIYVCLVTAFLPFVNWTDTQVFN